VACFQPSLRDSVNREDIPALKRRVIFKCPAGTIRSGFIVTPAALKNV
jgi:hypothetical protein